MIYKQVPEFLFPRTSVPSSPLSLLTVFSLTPFGVRAPAPPHGRPRAEPLAKPPRSPPVSSKTARPGAVLRSPRAPPSSARHDAEDGHRRAVAFATAQVIHIRRRRQLRVPLFIHHARASVRLPLLLCPEREPPAPWPPPLRARRGAPFSDPPLPELTPQ